MEPSLTSIIIVLVQVALVLVVGLLYLRRARVDRPPVGLFNGVDMAFVGAVLVLLPLVYLRLPTAILATVISIVTTAILYFALSPVVGGRCAFLAAVAVVVLNLAFWKVVREENPNVFAALNNLALAIAVVGVANLWVQSGIRASHVAFLASGLAVFDLVGTVALPLMASFVERISALPLAPVLSWESGRAQVGIGLGDLLLLLVWILVVEKAFSRRQALAAASAGLGCLLLLFMAFWLDVANRPLPAMVLLGPAIAIHYGWLVRREGRERTFAEYEASLSRPGAWPEKEIAYPSMGATPPDLIPLAGPLEEDAIARQ